MTRDCESSAVCFRSCYQCLLLLKKDLMGRWENRFAKKIVLLSSPKCIVRMFFYRGFSRKFASWRWRRLALIFRHLSTFMFYLASGTVLYVVATTTDRRDNDVRNKEKERRMLDDPWSALCTLLSLWQSQTLLSFLVSNFVALIGGHTLPREVWKLANVLILC